MIFLYLLWVSEQFRKVQKFVSMTVYFLGVSPWYRLVVITIEYLISDFRVEVRVIQESWSHRVVVVSPRSETCVSPWYSILWGAICINFGGRSSMIHKSHFSCNKQHTDECYCRVGHMRVLKAYFIDISLCKLLHSTVGKHIIIGEDFGKRRISLVSYLYLNWRGGLYSSEV